MADNRYDDSKSQQRGQADRQRAQAEQEQDQRNMIHNQGMSEDPNRDTNRGAPITPSAIAPTRDDDQSRNEATERNAEAQQKNDGKPVVAPAPYTTEDLSRSPPVNKDEKAPNYPGFPKTKYHPVYGARVAENPNEEAQFTPPHNWFDTAGEADTHRTDREAQQVIHHNRSVKNEAVLNRAQDDQHVTPVDVARGEAGVVRNSVQATEAVKDGRAEPL